MTRIEICSPYSDKIVLGQIVDFRIVLETPEAETRFFLKHDGLFYLQPLRDWGTENVLKVFPEAPGRYVLAGQWRAPGGKNGWAEKGFEVVSGQVQSAAPFLLKLDDETRIWVPTEWEARILGDSERAALDFLKTIVKPGMVVYDLGANLGVYSVLLARWIGAEGHVYSVEANPVCIQYLKTNIAINRLTNVEILPAAVLDRRGDISFSINYGNSNLGLAEESPFFALKSGHEISVACFEVDGLAREFCLRPPQLIKLDVEGAEIAAVQGMRETLERHRPVMAMELHGYEHTARTLEVLDHFGYRYTDPSSRATFQSAQQVYETFGTAVFQLIGFP